eukprot:1365985-Amorphochlora_amoeboformis.AAC.1
MKPSPRQSQSSQGVIYQPRLGGLGSLGLGGISGGSPGLLSSRYPTFHHSQLVTSSNWGGSSASTASSTSTHSHTHVLQHHANPGSETSSSNPTRLFQHHWGPSASGTQPKFQDKPAHTHASGRSNLWTHSTGLWGGGKPTRAGQQWHVPSVHSTSSPPAGTAAGTATANAVGAAAGTAEAKADRQRESKVNKGGDIKINYMPAEQAGFFDFLDSPSRERASEESQASQGEEGNAKGEEGGEA